MTGAPPTDVAHAARLVLVPSPLDFGAADPPVDIRLLLPDGVLRRAAALTHWLVEDARSARAFIKRAAVATGHAVDLPSLAIVEMPRARKGVVPAPRHARPGSVPDEREAVARALAPLAAGHDLGLLSEAGLPGIADPGRDWVVAAHDAGHPVEVLPGASAVTLALAASGLSGQSFAFVGYLPVEAGERRSRLLALEQASRRLAQAQVCIETPYRNPALLAAMLQVLAPSTRLSVSVGLTTPDGWTVSRTVAGWRRSPTAVPDRLPAVFCLQAA